MKNPDFRKKVFCLTIIFIVAFSASSQITAKDKSHQDIWLKNELGETITPGRNSTDPYSPRRTCGGCHGYSTITSGYHFQLQVPHASGKSPQRIDPISLMVPYVEKLSSQGRVDSGIAVYDWIGAGGKMTPEGKVLSVAAGWFHPGGGILEFSWKSDGTLDYSEQLSRKEETLKGAAAREYVSGLAPDGRSHFRESGVLEADCLICHLSGYKMKNRNLEIQKRNYRWAATAGSELGKITGSVFAYKDSVSGPERENYLSGTWNFSKRPVVDYTWSKFDKFTREGKLRGTTISGRVSSGNCLGCHALMEAFQTGSALNRDSDVHARANFRCTDCHVMLGVNKQDRLKHQIAGIRHQGSKETGMKTCKACHLEGRYRQTRSELPKEAVNPENKHSGKFPKNSFHFYVVGCTGCHAVEQSAKGGYLLDMSVGFKQWYTADDYSAIRALGESEKKAAKKWRPWMTRFDSGDGEGEQYLSCVPKNVQWFGQISPGGEITPIRLEIVRSALEGGRGLARISIEGAGEGKISIKTIAGTDEIKKALASLQKRGIRNAVFVSDRIYRIEQDKLTPLKMNTATLGGNFRIYHGVSPVSEKKTYGSKGMPGGCIDCHGKNAPFFSKMDVQNIGGFLKQDYPMPRENNARPLFKKWGLTEVPPMMKSR